MQEIKAAVSRRHHKPIKMTTQTRPLVVLAFLWRELLKRVFKRLLYAARAPQLRLIDAWNLYEAYMKRHQPRKRPQLKWNFSSRSPADSLKASKLKGFILHVLWKNLLIFPTHRHIKSIIHARSWPANALTFSFFSRQKRLRVVEIPFTTARW